VENDKVEGRASDLGVRDKVIGGLRRFVGSLTRPEGRTQESKEIEPKGEQKKQPQGISWK
jgi:hypothetical protein